MATAVGFPAKDLKVENPIGLRQLASTTSCTRCGGFMVIEQCFDFRDDTGQIDFLARRCVQCGEVIDRVILQNRQRQLPVGRVANHTGSGFSRSKEGN